MPTKQIKEKLESLKLNAIAARADSVLKSLEVNTNAFYESLEPLLDIQLEQDENAKVNRARKAATLRWPQATLASVDYDPKAIKTLSEYEWIDKHQHVVIVGATGSGKTHFACALANHIIVRGFKLKFIKYNDLLIELELAEQSDKLKAYFRKMLRTTVLVIDDWALTPISSIQRRLLFDLIEKREQESSLIITSQFDFDLWHEAIGEETIADALLDRIAPLSHKVVMNGAFRGAEGLLGSGKPNNN